MLATAGIKTWSLKIPHNLLWLGFLLDYQDILFYVESKNKREDATYSTKTKYSKQETEQLRVKSTLFVSKIKLIIEEKND